MSSHMDYQVPVPDQVKELLTTLGRNIKAEMPRGWGFTLMIFTLGADGTMTYISSANRKDMIAAMKEFIQTLEGA